MPSYRSDCRHFEGDRPCRFRRPCEGCPHFAPLGRRVLIVKLAARGDVLRTTPLLPALKQAWPESHVTWVTRPESLEMLEGLAEIDRLLPLDADALARLGAERFDEVWCLDKEPAATGLAARVAADTRRGFLLGPHGNLVPADADAEYAFRLGIDDELKFRVNQRTHQEITFEMVGLPWRRQPYRLEVPPAAVARAGERWADCGLEPGERVIGLNVGAGEAFAHKDWRVDGFAELADRVRAELGLRVALLGGPDDRPRVDAVAKRVPDALDPGAAPSILEFAALLGGCAAVVSGDTLAMHLALARAVPVVAIFGSTCPQEIELYDRGERVVPAIACHPCYRRRCDLDPSCADAVSAEQVFQALLRVLGAAA